MKVEITQVRKIVVDIGKNDGTDIDDLVLDKYNNLKDSDFSPLNTEMYYKPLTLEPSDLDVKYRIMDVAEWLVKYFHDSYGEGPKLFQINVIMYLIYEHCLYNEGFKIFDADFMSDRSYPKSIQMWRRWCTCVATSIFRYSKAEVIKLEPEDEKIITRIADKYASLQFFDVHTVMRNTVYERMICAGVIDKEIEF